MKRQWGKKRQRLRRLDNTLGFSAVEAIGVIIQDCRIRQIRAVTIECEIAPRICSRMDDRLIHRGQGAIGILRSWFGEVEARGAMESAGVASFLLAVGNGVPAMVAVVRRVLRDRMRIAVAGMDGTLESDGVGQLVGPVAAVPNGWADQSASDAYNYDIARQDAFFLRPVFVAGYPRFDEMVAKLQVIRTLRSVAAGR